jgi:hypothetical protein
MRRNASVPCNLHSDLHRRARAAVSGEVRGEVRGETCGFVLLRATRGARKAMHVQFVAAAGALVIRIVQDAGGRRQTFDLCRLDYRALAVRWIWNYPTAFILAAAHDGRLYHEIYCYPTDASRNAWLRVFEAKSVMSAPWFDLDRRSDPSSDPNSDPKCSQPRLIAQ